MRRPAPLRVLCYAVNGLGLGHLTRLVAVCRQLRRLATALELPVEILFLTSSEGDALASLHGFATFKVPSKTLAASCGLDPHRYRKIARQWIWNAINLISPDLLLVDTFPAGSFGELTGVLDLGSRNVFIHREVRPEVASHPSFQMALRGYDLILRIREEAHPAEPPEDAALPGEVRDRVATIGPVLLRSASETYEPPAARELLGLPPELPAVYVSTGGGGDREAESLLGDIVRAATTLPDARFIIGAGLLYRGREWPAPNVTWTRRPVLVECFRAFDAAITAGGFNTVWELMHCGVPCLFLPRPRGWDDQEQRAARCAAAGAGKLLASREPAAIREALQELLDPQQRERSAAAARSLLPLNDAPAAAEEILSVVVDRARVEKAALLLDAGTLFESEQAGIPESDLLRVAAVIAARTDAETTAETAEDALEAARRLLRLVTDHGGGVRQALTALKKVERRPDAEQVYARAVEYWEEGREL
ncbi:MAG TPA: glycosyltransferase [Armatimonadota bacterium]|nr:glycosyltransferase [Armatimonadota bacterium]